MPVTIVTWMGDVNHSEKRFDQDISSFMPEGTQAIDFMFYVATPEFMERWDRAKEGELLCRMEQAIGGLPRYNSIEEMLGRMDEAGVERVFIAQCKMWSYRRKWMYMDTQLDDVLQYTVSPRISWTVN